MSGHEKDLKGALRGLPAPDPSPDLLPRILRSRAVGKRITFPTRESAATWRWIAAAAVVTALISGSWVVSLSLSKMGASRGSGRDPLAELLRGTMMWPSTGDAQQPSGKPPQPKYPLVSSDSLDPSRLMEGVWTYRSETTTDGVLTEPSGGARIQLTRVTYAGRPALMLTTAKPFRTEGWGVGDTTYLDASTLRPEHAVAYGYKGRTRLVQTFSGDSARESLEITGPMHGSYRGAIALPFPRNALFVNDWSLIRVGAILPALPLARGWRGSLYQLVFLSRIGLKGVAPVDLRVVGRDRVTVPAGTFECWRVEVEIHHGETQRRTVWVSRDKGWVIKEQARWSDFVVDRLLQSYEPGS